MPCASWYKTVAPSATRATQPAKVRSATACSSRVNKRVEASARIGGMRRLCPGEFIAVEQRVGASDPQVRVGIGSSHRCGRPQQSLAHAQSAARPHELAGSILAQIQKFAREIPYVVTSQRAARNFRGLPGFRRKRPLSGRSTIAAPARMRRALSRHRACPLPQANRQSYTLARR